MANALSGWHLLILLTLILLLFGSSKLPSLAKGLGQSLRIFKREMEEIKKEEKNPAPAAEDKENTKTTDTSSHV